MFAPSDHDLLARTLGSLNASGVALAPGIEAADVEDSLCDDLTGFRTFPVASVCALRDPDDAPMLHGVSLEALTEAVCLLNDTALTDFAVFPDPGSAHAGSLRIRLGAWDVADIDYDLSSRDALTGEIRQIETRAARPR